MGRINTTGSAPGYVAEYSSLVRGTGRQIDWGVLDDSWRSSAWTVKVNDAAAAQGDTALGVDALAQALPKGTILWFAAGDFARLTADAAKGAVSLTVEALVNAISDDATATVGGAGVKRIKAGTIMVEQANGKMVPRIARLNSETSIGFLTADAEEGAYNDALSGHGVLIGGVFYKELLPEQANGNFATWVGEINTAGPGVRLETFSDSRAS